MRKILLLLALMLVIIGCSQDVQPSEYLRISMSEAQTMMREQTGYIIVDVRTAEEYNKAHIPGAINIPNESISSSPPPELADKDQLIMIYCRSGNRSRQASQKLADLGYTNIVEFGGINDWTGETVSEIK